MSQAATQELIFTHSLTAESVACPGQFWTVREYGPGKWEIDCTCQSLRGSLEGTKGSVDQCCAWVADAEASRAEQVKLARVLENKFGDCY